MVLNIFFWFSLFFQSKYITIVDLETRRPIPYASFISLKDAKGGYADEKGLIYFSGDSKQLFIVSCTGYLPDTVDFSVDTVRLKPVAVQLATVIVSAKKGKM